jgi:hypothetical protein
MIKIAIDLDNTITASKQSIEFFSVLTKLLIVEHRIVILTDREPNSEQEISHQTDHYDIANSSIASSILLLTLDMLIRTESDSTDKPNRLTLCFKARNISSRVSSAR